MPKHRTLGISKRDHDPLSKDQQMICGAMTKARRHRYDLSRRQRICHNPPMPGRTRCKFHGGASTGAITAEGRARSVAAMLEGRRVWVEGLKEQGAKIPGGRRAGAGWVTRAMRERQEASWHSETPHSQAP